MSFSSSSDYVENPAGLVNLPDFDPQETVSDAQKIRFQLKGGIDIAAKISDIGTESFRARVFSGWNSVRFTVMTNAGGLKHCDLNISSLSKKLGISRSRIKRIARLPNGLEVLDKIAFVRGTTLEKCNQIKAGSEIIEGNLVKNGVLLDVRSNTLSKIVEMAVRSTVITPAPPETVALKSFKLYGKRFFVEHIGDEEINIFSSLIISTGTYGKVYKLTNLETTSNFALKKARKKYLGRPSELPRLNLGSEADILRELNPDGHVEGIQKPPFSKASRGMYIAPLYSGDLISSLSSFAALPIENRLELCRQLLSGLCTLHDEGYVHGDIKPDNCLVERDADGNITQFVIGDFGGVKHVDDHEKKCSHSPEYLPPDFYDQLDNGFEKSYIIECCDVYAMSKTLIEILLGDQFRSSNHLTEKMKTDLETIKNPVMRDAVRKILTNFMIDGSNYRQIRRRLMYSGVPGEVANVLINGMLPYQTRPESDQIYEDFCSALVLTGMSIAKV